MERRRYLALAGAACPSVLAGCLDSGGNDGDDSGDDGTATNESSDDGTDNGETDDGNGETGDGNGETGDGNGEFSRRGDRLPVWTEWVPADVVTGGRRLSRIDTDALRTEFSDEIRSQFQVTRLPSVYGFAPEAMDAVVSVQDSSGTVLEVVIGSFDVQQTLEAIGAAEQVDETYRGFEFLDQQRLAIGPSAIIIGDRRQSIDTRAGDAAALGWDGGNWERIASLTADNTILSAEADPAESRSPPFEVELFATTFDAAGNGQFQTQGHYLFDSEAAATDVNENRREELTGHFVGQSQGSVERIEQDGALLTVVATNSMENL